MDPRSPRAARDLGVALLWLRRHAQAREALDRAQALSPGDLFVVQQRAMVPLARGDLAGAAALLRPLPEGIDSIALVVFFAHAFDLYWILNRAQQELLLQLTPKAFGDNRAAWAIVLAQTYSLRGNLERSRAYADSAREAFEEQLESAPSDPQPHIFRGLALAYLGRRAEAIEEGERGSKLMPLTENAFEGAYYQHQVARIYTIVGEPDRALDRLERLLAIPYYLTARWLRIDPNFSPLHGHPRFRRLVGTEPISD